MVRAVSILTTVLAGVAIATGTAGGESRYGLRDDAQLYATVTKRDKPFGSKGKKSLAPPRKPAPDAAPQGGAAKTRTAPPKPSAGGSTPAGRTSIVDIQPGAKTSVMTLEGAAGEAGQATLIDLNPEVGIAYLLRIRWPGETRENTVNLETARLGIRIALDPQYKGGVVVTDGRSATLCPLFGAAQKATLAGTVKAQTSYTSYCDGQLFTRNKVDGRKTTKEWVAEFLRDNVWGGEEVTTFVKDKFFKDKFLIASQAQVAGAGKRRAATGERVPPAGKVGGRDLLLTPANLGLSIVTEDSGKVLAGQWYESKTQDGVFVSAIEPNLIDPAILGSHKALVSALDAVEAKALVYLVAFDLSEFEMSFTMGTDHPRVDWSPRVLEEVRDRSTPGPDGIGNWDPVVTTGMVNPVQAPFVVATFTGGFKRDHGALKWGSLAYKNKGSHYGVIENGVVFSKLNPGLSTLFQSATGEVAFKTWEESDAAEAGKLRYARQNGVPIVEWDEATQSTIPGKLVRQWGPGNWSGSEDSRLRTLRAATCLVETPSRRFLVYGYFSTATPSAMARVFQAYGCRYAMHMDMNALEHTYLAVYARDAKMNLKAEHLITGMSVLDQQFKNRVIPRFLGFPDNRDFFHLVRKERK